MDVEKALICVAVREGALQQIVSREIKPDHFITKSAGDEPATSEVWEWILTHRHRYRSAPSIELFKRRWPTFRMVESTDPPAVVLDEFIRVIKRREGINRIRDLSIIVDDWARVGEIEVYFREAAQELARLVPTTSVHRFSDSLDRLALYRKRQETGDTPGISTLIQEIDDLTYGVQPFEMLVIEGFLNMGKSSMGVGMCAKSYFERGETPLFMTLEMEGDKLNQRWDAYALGVEYSAMKRLKLGEGDLKRWEEIGQRAADSRLEKDAIVIDDLYHPSVERVFNEVERWDPNFVVVDPIDEISVPSMYKTLHERQGYAARELKGLARHLRKPFVVMAQAGRDAEQEGAKIGNIAGSIDIARKADIAIGLHSTPDQQKMHKMQFELLKNRDDGGKGFKTNYYMHPGKMEIRPWRPEDTVAERTSEPVA